MVMASCLTVSVPRRKNTSLHRNSVVTASCLTFFVPSWNTIVVILDGVVMVMARCLTESAPRRKKNDIQNYCGYGQLPGVVRSKLEANITNSRQVTARCLTLIWWR